MLPRAACSSETLRLDSHLKLQNAPERGAHIWYELFIAYGLRKVSLTLTKHKCVLSQQLCLHSVARHRRDQSGPCGCTCEGYYLCNVAPYSIRDRNRRFGGLYCLDIEGSRVNRTQERGGGRVDVGEDE
jgi:hypothetical protein